jgi:hypothetical protein
MHFSEEFWKQKLETGGGFMFLSQLDNDEAVKSNLRRFVKQFYNSRCTEQDVKSAKEVLDTIIAKLHSLKLIDVYKVGERKKDRRFSKKVDLVFEDIVKQMTSQFQNDEKNYSSLYKVIEYLNDYGTVPYYDLVNEIRSFFIAYTTGRIEEQQAERQHITPEGDEETPEASGIDDIEYYNPEYQEDFEDSPENPEITRSYLSEIVSRDLRSTVTLFSDKNELLNELQYNRIECLPRTRKLVELILKKVEITDLNIFMLCWLIKGKLEGPIPNNVLETLCRITGKGKSTVYERYKKFQLNLSELKSDDNLSFNEDDFISAILQIHQVYERKYAL